MFCTRMQELLLVESRDGERSSDDGDVGSQNPAAAAAAAAAAVVVAASVAVAALVRAAVGEVIAVAVEVL